MTWLKNRVSWICWEWVVVLKNIGRGPLTFLGLLCTQISWLFDLSYLSSYDLFYEKHWLKLRQHYLGCNASVMLHVCCGTKNQENQGHWYEAVCHILLFLKPKLTATKFQCTAPAHLSHFICWQYDITPSADFVSSVKNPPRTFQSLLQIPITPLKTTPHMNSSSRAVPPLPALTIPPAPTVTLKAPLEHYAGVTATTDHFHNEENTGPTDLESLGALNGSATVVARAALGTPSPSSAKSAGTSVTIRHLHTCHQWVCAYCL